MASSLSTVIFVAYKQALCKERKEEEEPARTLLNFELFRPGLDAKYWHGDVIQR